MVLGRIKPSSDRVGEWLARPLVAVGFSANGVTGLSLAFALAGAALLGFGFLLWGGVAFGLVLVLDMLDGAVARLRGTVSPWGATLDATLDRLGDGLFLLGLAAYVPTGVGWALALAAAVLGNAVSYVKAKGDLEGAAAGRGRPSSTGVDLFERTERFFVLYVSILVELAGIGAGRYSAIEAGFALLVVGSLLTLVQRLWRARRALA